MLDRVNMKMPFEEKVGGQVAVCVSGDTGMKWEPYYSGMLRVNFLTHEMSKIFGTINFRESSHSRDLLSRIDPNNSQELYL